MIIVIKYCQHMRKDGSFNTCAIDTTRKVYCNHTSACRYDEPHAFVEAHISKDVDSVRRCVIESGYREVTYEEFKGKEKTA